MPSLVFGQDIDNNNRLEDSQKFRMYKECELSKISFPIKLCVQDIVQLLKIDLGLKVNFESESFAPVEGGLKASQIIKMYESKTDSELSKRERFLLEFAKNIIKTEKGDAIIDYLKRYAQFDKCDLMDFNKLVIKIESTNVYCVKILNDSIIIYPKNVSYKKVDNFCGEFSSYEDSLKKVDDILKEHELHIMEFFIGPVSNKDYKHWAYPRKAYKKIKIDVSDEDFRIFLVKYCEAIAPDVIWSISGYSSGRHIQFSRTLLQRFENFNDSFLNRFLENNF